MNQPGENQNWRSNLLVTSGVILTVMMALLMSQIDLLQVPLKPTPSFVAALQPTVNHNPSTDSKLTAVSLPTATKTPAPTATLSGSPESTAVSMLIHCGEVPAGWTVYEVRANDTLLTLSAFAATSAAAIAKANCIENEFVFEGMILYLPVRAPTAVPCGPPNWWVRYVVQPGDTLSNLAARTGTTVYAIMQANCMDNTYLTAGRSIYLPRYPYTYPTATRPIIPTWTATPPVPTASPTIPPVTVTAVVTPSPSPTVISTATATNTPDPNATVTASPTPDTPTTTPDATLTAIPVDTATPGLPTDTPVPPPTNTPEPATATAVPPTDVPTNTPVPLPTNTSVPPPINTPAPPPTNTPIPPPSATP